MEKVIDRKEYRRNNEKEKILEEEQIDIIQGKIRRILIQLLGVSIILLGISFLKFFNCIDILNKIDAALNTEISLSSLQKNGQRIYEVASNYYTQLETFVEKMLNNSTVSFNGNDTRQLNVFQQIDESGEINSEKIVSGENIYPENIFLSNNVSGNNILLNEENIQYESAVEGINQMSEDANFIKENYKMIIPVIGTITSEFGVRNSSNPIVGHYHSGLDIAANTGTQILAAIDGKVIEATSDTYYGKYLKIQKDDMVIIYAHCSKLLVKVGDTVKKGKLIAYVGNTGNSTGPHLHFEIKYKDRLVNPEDVLEF